MEKNYDHNKYENNLYNSWEKSGKMMADNLSKKKPFTIPLPPPNVTGQLHLGHAAMLAIEDILIRYKKMTNHEVCWIPATDHASIATTAVMVKKLGIKNQNEANRDKFLEECRKFSHQKQKRIITQMKKMGAWLDWSRESYTLDEPRSFSVTKMFKQLYEDGLIERGHRMVNWSVGAQSVISDDELEWEVVKEPFYYIRCGEFIIGTVRPETKCADSPIILHPTAKYVRVEFTDTKNNSEIFILGKHCFENQKERNKICNLLDPKGTFKVLETFAGNDLVEKRFEAETFAGTRKFFVTTDEVIDPKKGTGIMTISANHSSDDYDLVQRLNLKEYFFQKIDFEGKMTSLAGKCAGMEVQAARKFSGNLMKNFGILVGIDVSYEHKVPTCYRSGCVIEPMVSPQWFVVVEKEFIDKHTQKTTTLKKLTQEAVRKNHIKIIPKQFEKTYFHWIDNLRDWCISRQIWWGHQMPVWYDEEKNIYTPEEKKVIFIRHGETDDGFNGFIQTPKSPLNKKGISEAEKVSEEISGKNITKILTSNSARALETAEIIGKKLGIKVEIIPEFNGADFGIFAGKKTSDVYDAKKETLLEITEKSKTGENKSQIFERIQKGWKKIKQIKTEGNILLVSHRTILSGLEGVLNGKNADSLISNRLKTHHRASGKIWGESCIFTEPQIPGKNLKQENDTLDTWFSSALWPMSPLGWPQTETPDFQKFYPSDILETGHDILFFWVARMLMFGRYATGKYPFHTVYLHGLVCDEHGKKMSKSKNNGIDPLEVIEEVGADAVRLSLIIGSSPGNNIPIGKNKIKAYRNFVNKLWNAGRFVKMQMEQKLSESSPEKKLNKKNIQEIVEKKELVPKSLAEKWILSRFSIISKEVSQHLEAFEISAAGDKIYHFVWNEFCSWFLEAQKIQKNPEFLSKIFQQILTLVHPLCPFVTEQLWKDLYLESNFLIEEPYPNLEIKNEQAEKKFLFIQTIITDIRRVRIEQKLNPKQKIPGIFVGDLQTEEKQLIQELGGISELKIEKKIPGILEHAIEINGNGYTLFIEIPFDEKSEAERISKEKETIIQKITRLEERLMNKKYVQNAPKKLVEDTKIQLEEAKQLLKKIS